MSDPNPATEIFELTGRILGTLDAHVLGARRAAEVVLATYMARGHVLVEGVPGIGKTLLARCFAACLGLEMGRLQFTPDLMPTDVTGVNVFDAASGSFKLWRGPVFSQLLMADEINRTPPKTQSALLEAMQERQVTIDAVSYRLDPLFFVIATQNPVEFEGTYPLPEAQLDRFLARVSIGTPEASAEVEIFRRAAAGTLTGWSQPARLPEAVVTPAEAAALRSGSERVHVAESLLAYLHQLLAVLRRSEHVELAVSPRGALSLLELARAGALLEGRAFVTPDDLRRFIHPCWDHRILLTPESELEGVSAHQVVERAAESVEVPRQ
jgi:MoxR-like ATPase